MSRRPPRKLTAVLLSALQELNKHTTPQPMRVLARALAVRPQVLALRVWRLRLRGLADKPGDEAYTITKLGRKHLKTLET